jgi:hypothetical protein
VSTTVVSTALATGISIRRSDLRSRSGESGSGIVQDSKQHSSGAADTFPITASYVGSRGSSGQHSERILASHGDMSSSAQVAAPITLCVIPECHLLHLPCDRERVCT